ncbi:hypothetical protein IIA16_05880 [bacterium]|nr:hypothetical protein [bacterium]
MLGIGVGALSAGASFVVGSLLAMGIGALLRTLLMIGIPISLTGKHLILLGASWGFGFGVAWLLLPPCRLPLRPALLGAASTTLIALLALGLGLWAASMAGIDNQLLNHYAGTRWLEPSLKGLTVLAFGVLLSRRMNPPLRLPAGLWAIGAFLVVVQVMYRVVASDVTVTVGDSPFFLQPFVSWFAAAIIGWGGVTGAMAACRDSQERETANASLSRDHLA